MNDISTREKILNHAHKLFADKGYNGVSVREISKAADVNVAAINYHFENKERLFKETISLCLTKMADNIDSLYNENKPVSTESLAILVFDHFNKHSEDLRTSFKIFMSDSDIFPEKANTDDEMIGPPGGSVFYACIKDEKPNATHDDLIFAVRTIFTVIIHKSLICSCKNIHENKKLYKNQLSDFNESIKRLVRITLNDLN